MGYQNTAAEFRPELQVKVVEAMGAASKCIADAIFPIYPVSTRKGYYKRIKRGKGQLLANPGTTTAADPLKRAPGSAYREVKVLRGIRAIRSEDLVRGQFVGYRAEEGVAAHSQVETFAAVRLWIDSWRWEGVPFYARAGKKLPVTATEVLVRLKAPPIKRIVRGPTNYVRLRLGPEVEIALGARVKRPGDEFETRMTELALMRQPSGEDMGPYERLLGEAMDGDPILFARQDAVETAWEIVGPVLQNPSPAYDYEPGTWGPVHRHQTHTQTGQYDCKFGMTRAELLEAANFCKEHHLPLAGIHFHRDRTSATPSR